MERNLLLSWALGVGLRKRDATKLITGKPMPTRVITARARYASGTVDIADT